MKNTILHKIPILIITLTLTCCSNNHLNTFNKEEIKQFKNFNDLNELDYLRLIASIQVLDSIFIERDTSFKIFKDLMELEIYKPVIIRARSTNHRQTVANKMIDQLNNYRKSSQLSYKINYTESAYADTTKSTIGVEATKLIDEIKKASR